MQFSYSTESSVKTVFFSHITADKLMKNTSQKSAHSCHAYLKSLDKNATGNLKPQRKCERIHVLENQIIIIENIKSTVNHKMRLVHVLAL